MKATKSKPRKPAKVFSAEERAAMKEHAKEVKRAQEGADGLAEVLAAIAAMAEPDRAMAKRVHALVTAAAPSLSPKTWYGMPAYARDGNVVCFFQAAQKFKTRYGTLGFSDKAQLDDGALWPVAFALKELSDASAAKITALVKRAAAG